MQSLKEFAIQQTVSHSVSNGANYRFFPHIISGLYHFLHVREHESKVYKSAGYTKL